MQEEKMVVGNCGLILIITCLTTCAERQKEEDGKEEQGNFPMNRTSSHFTTNRGISNLVFTPPSQRTLLFILLSPGGEFMW